MPLDRPLVSLHFPKSSGTAFWLALKAAFGDAVLGSYDSDPVDPANPIWTCPDWFRRTRPRALGPYRAVHGHFPIQNYDLLPSALRVVMLRDPVETIVSVHYYWRSLFDTPAAGHAIYELAKRERLSLLELAEVPRLRRLMSETYFGGYDMRRFDVIGAYDRRAEFAAAVSARTGLGIAADAPANVTPESHERGDTLADSRLMARLRDLLRDDVRFYEAHTGGRRRGWAPKPVFVAAVRRALPRRADRAMRA